MDADSGGVSRPHSERIGASQPTPSRRGEFKPQQSSSRQVKASQQAPQRGRGGAEARRRGLADAARIAAFEVLRRVNGGGAYANLAASEVIDTARLDSRDAGFVTELTATTFRALGTIDLIIERAAGRKLSTLQPAVVDVLRLATTQLLLMRVPLHAGVDSSVNLSRAVVGERVTGIVNAVSRKIGAKTFEEWLDVLTESVDRHQEIAVRTMHPRWVVGEYAKVVPDSELMAALGANNEPPTPTLAVRPGLATVRQLKDATPARWSPYGAYRDGNPAELVEVRDGRVGVQDEGSQLVTLAFAAAASALDDTNASIAPSYLTDSTSPTASDGLVKSRWLDMCSGPGGKTGLLAGLKPESVSLYASELAFHRAKLVAQAVRGYPAGRCQLVCADATQPPWQPDSFTKILLDAPCSGLGALRRRPESRWRKTPEILVELARLQTQLLDSALTLVRPGGVIGYITCTLTVSETAAVVNQFTDRVEILDAPKLLPQVPDCRAATDPRFIQLMPHRHQTDAMFCALLRRVR